MPRQRAALPETYELSAQSHESPRMYWFYSLLTERYLVCDISGWGVVGYTVCLGIGFMVYSLNGIWCVLYQGGEL